MVQEVDGILVFGCKCIVLYYWPPFYDSPPWSNSLPWSPEMCLISPFKGPRSKSSVSSSEADVQPFLCQVSPNILCFFIIIITSNFTNFCCVEWCFHGQRKQVSFTGMDSREAGKEEFTVEAACNHKETAPVTTGEDHDPSLPTQVFGALGGLKRQSSMTKGTCLCSPTTHAGSFRCRLHRIPSLQRTKSIDASLPAPDSPSKTDTYATDCAMGPPVGNYEYWLWLIISSTVLLSSYSIRSW